jgi:hypothetical protein
VTRKVETLMLALKLTIVVAAARGLYLFLKGAP